MLLLPRKKKDSKLEEGVKYKPYLAGINKTWH